MAALLPSGTWLSLPLPLPLPLPCRRSNPSSFMASPSSPSNYTTNFRCCSSISQMHSPEASEKGKFPIIPHTPPLRLAASAVVFLSLSFGFGIGARSCSAASSLVPPSPAADNYNLEEEKVVPSKCSMFFLMLLASVLSI